MRPHVSCVCLVKTLHVYSEDFARAYCTVCTTVLQCVIVMKLLDISILGLRTISPCCYNPHQDVLYLVPLVLLHTYWLCNQ